MKVWELSFWITLLIFSIESETKIPFPRFVFYPGLTIQTIFLLYFAFF